MPCGGIHIISKGPGELDEKLTPPNGGCWVCDQGGCQHFCDEWDTYIHARCVPKFLLTDEGQCIIEHGHEVYLDFSLEAK